MMKLMLATGVAAVLLVIVQAQCGTPPCPANEVYNTCVNAQCGPINCSQRDVPQFCPAVSSCTPGCACQQGYLREDDTRLCVPRSQCRSPKVVTCNPRTQEYSDCANAQCKPEFCSEQGNPQVCPAVSSCQPGCVCLQGYLKDDTTGECKPADQC